MKRLWILYLFCTVFGIFSIYMAHALIGPYPLTDGRHSLAFYVWALTAGTSLLIAATGISVYLADKFMEK